MRTLAFGASAALLVALSAGCSRDPTADKVAAMNTSNLQRVTNIYEAFQNVKSGGGPKSEADLKQFIREYDPSKLAMMKIDVNNLDALFTSERDSKPFKVRYGVGGGRGSVAPVVFEQDGVAGKKQVGFTGGKIEEVDDATAAQLWTGKRPDAGAGGADGRPGKGGPAGAPKGPGT